MLFTNASLKIHILIFNDQNIISTGVVTGQKYKQKAGAVPATNTQSTF